MAYPAPRRLQLRRGNTAAVSAYLGNTGELVVNTDNWTLYVHDGVTVGGYAATVNTASINGNISSILNGTAVFGNIIPNANVTYSLGNVTHQWKDLFVSNNTIYVGGVPLTIDTTGNLRINGNVIPTIGYVNTAVANVTVDLSSYALNANVTAANVGMRGYVDQANTIQSAQLTSANLGIIGYIDQSNTIQASAITAANVGMKGYVDNAVASIVIPETYSNVNVAAYLTTEGYAKTADITTANLGVVGYVDQQISNLIGGAPGILDTLGEIAASINDDANVYASLVTSINSSNVAMKGYVDQANTIQSAQISAANIGIIGYVDNAVSTANVGIIGYINQGNTIQAAAITAANVGLKGYVDFANTVMKAYVDGQIIAANANVSSSGTNYSNANVASYLPTHTGNVGVNYLLGTTPNVTVTAGTFDSVFDNQGNVTVPKLFTAGNIQTAGYLFGNGAFLTGIVASGGSGTNYSNVNVQAYTETMGFTNYSNVNVAAYMSAQGITSYSNVQVAAYLPTYLGNVSAVNFVGGTSPGVGYNFSYAQDAFGATVDNGSVYLPVDNNSNAIVAGYTIVGNSGAVTLTVLSTNYVESSPSFITVTTSPSAAIQYPVTVYTANYSPAASSTITVGNATVAGNVTATYFVGNGAFLTGIAASSNYSNVDVANYLPTYAGTVSASLVNTSGNILASGLSVFGNARIGLAGTVGGQFHSVVGNITQTSSGGAVYFNTTGNVLAAAVVAGAVTSTGTVAVNAATGITTNQATFLLANANATTINIGGAATTIRMGTNTSNVWVGRALGNQTRELLIRAQGTWNTAINIDSNGGFNSPPYTNQPVIGGSGTGMTANYSATGGYITSLTIYNRGSGYQNGDVLSVPGGIAGNSFTLTNYSSTLTGNSSAAYTFGIEGNLTVPGNVIATRFIGDGSLLTGISSGGSNYSNVNVQAYTESMGFQNYGNVNVAALITTNGLTNYSNVNVAAYIPSYAGNIANVRLGTSGILTFPDGSQQTTAAFGGGSNYGNANVAAFLPTYTGATGITQIGTLATLAVSGNATVGNLVGTEANTRIIANTHVTTFDIYGNVTFPANVIATRFIGNGALLTSVVTQTTGSWTVTAGTNTYSFTVPANAVYQLWIRGNIPNGIISYLATVHVTNTNVPVLGSQRAYNYTDGGSPILLTSMPAQIIGTEGTISNTVVSTTTANQFDFGISNTSGESQVVYWGYNTL